jgi:NADPH2:quinone reductase
MEVIMDIEIRLRAPGVVEMLEPVEVASPEPGPHDVHIRHEAIGVNFIDIYHRTGLYPVGSLPAVLGVEGAGIVEAVGSRVTSLKRGDRVAYGGAPLGAYASTRLLPAERAIRIPDGVSSLAAAALTVRGITARMLLKRVYPVGPGTVMLVHAAAGGLGQILARWGKRLGATVFASVGSEEKAKIARDCGADHVIIYRDEDLVARARQLTEGRGVDVVYDGIGADTFQKSLACLKPFGVVASIGQAGGPIPLLDLGKVRTATISRPSVMAYMMDLAAYREAAQEVLELAACGFPVSIGPQYALLDAARAHTDLETGRTTGSVLLIP